MAKIRWVQTNEYSFASECPPDTFAGTVVIWDKPSVIFLYSERGRKFANHYQFYLYLWNRGFRYFKHLHKGEMWKLEEV